ncbi:TetR/AcrR family transcriptional regulator [Cellulomonas sp. zg-ZUI222]|uniref:TetR/AcrR family transcriptional regulator n=1 Tax=Cellulomonas wangleii TaxID=2816956 RepID=A0ABX8D473_9CELL|nr:MULTISPECIES: TetR/AcrR family transcriptional regulator [Cellulomonas]MBO0898758.1 TetR/AcrR family transcriptional regulator [Cellulomonas sp. zg-ZUI22]MBO0919619.1 TetR/AcrR family transcriptional regulator [Cellulomonas wangleii]MBO0923954.1 TetR/AcrR family transcriptional regulator [Cellulomonas wangleii]MBO0924236.1 TetR/AcrR family transcriptional regulator [Cellulomonas wangleii]QVI62248.1 TetR/AcrR family transcriptional regulator [Cellulomonas wangleii]
MPRITARTVPEHREAQRRAILDATRELLADAPDVEPTFAAVAAKAGLARSSIYHYFPSREDLFRAVVVEALPRWSEAIAQAMGAQDDPVARVVAYADANLRLVAEGEHAVISALAAFSPRAFSDPWVQEMHGQHVEPLVAALRGAGVAEPEVVAELVNAMVQRAGALIEGGADVDTVRAAVRAVLTR